MINFNVEIYNEQTKSYESYIDNAVFPLKVANLLDEQLDECSLTLKQCSEPFFRPLTLVKITIVNSPEARFSQSDFDDFVARQETQTNLSYDPSTKRITERRTFEMVVASDNPVEVPNGSGLYNHEIYLIELTKVLEGYIGDSITFTNALGNDYIGQNS